MQDASVLNEWTMIMRTLLSLVHVRDILSSGPGHVGFMSFENTSPQRLTLSLEHSMLFHNPMAWVGAWAMVMRIVHVRTNHNTA